MTRHPIRPGLHFEKDFAAVTVSIQSATSDGLAYQPALVTSEREYVSCDSGLSVKLATETRLLTGKPICSPSLERWSLEGIEDFCKHKRPPDGMTVVQALKAVLLEQMTFPDDMEDEYASLLALWTVGTYFHPLFRAYPYLELCAPRGSGKSKLQGILCALSHAGHLIVDPTEAATFRLIEAARSTILFDECENWSKQARGAFLQIINSGYTQDGIVMRCDGEAHNLRAFMVYSPKTFASITGVDSVTATRCIRLHLRRTHDEKGQRWFDPLAPEVLNLRDSLYYLCLSRFKDILASLANPFTSKLNNRTYQLWLPLLTLAKLCGGKKLFAQIEAVANFYAEQAREPALPQLDQALLYALWNTVADDGSEYTAEALVDKVVLTDSWEKQHLTPQRVGIALARLGFTYTHRSNGNFYSFQRDKIKAIAEAYDVALANSETDTTTNPDWSKVK